VDALPTPGWAEFTIMMECTPEKSGHCWSIFTLSSVVVSNEVILCEDSVSESGDTDSVHMCQHLIFKTSLSPIPPTGLARH
jgi:hypothetical protein